MLNIKVMQLTEEICLTRSVDCRNLSKSELARKLMDLANISDEAIISEIPLDWDNQVEILYTIPGDYNYYSLFAGKNDLTISIEGTFTDNNKYYDFFDDSIMIINYLDNSINTISEKEIEKEIENKKQNDLIYINSLMENYYNSLYDSFDLAELYYNSFNSDSDELYYQQELQNCNNHFKNWCYKNFNMHNNDIYEIACNIADVVSL